MKTIYFQLKTIFLSIVFIVNAMHLNATIHTIDATANLTFVPAE